MSLSGKIMEIARYSIVICRHPNGKYLCVKERTGKWWVPGGSLEKGETHLMAAKRETWEEAGIELDVKGILAFDQVNFGKYAFRVIYYGEPVDPRQVPKKTSDNESQEAQYLTLSEILQLKPHWRAP